MPCSIFRSGPLTPFGKDDSTDSGRLTPFGNWVEFASEREELAWYSVCMLPILLHGPSSRSVAFRINALDALGRPDIYHHRLEVTSVKSQRRSRGVTCIGQHFRS